MEEQEINLLVILNRMEKENSANFAELKSSIQSVQSKMQSYHIEQLDMMEFHKQDIINKIIK